jgi:hypothetical protein
MFALKNKGDCLLMDFDMAMEWPPEPGPRTIHWDISVSLLALYQSNTVIQPSSRGCLHPELWDCITLRCATAQVTTWNQLFGWSYRC